MRWPLQTWHGLVRLGGTRGTHNSMQASMLCAHASNCSYVAGPALIGPPVVGVATVSIAMIAWLLDADAGT